MFNHRMNLINVFSMIEIFFLIFLLPLLAGNTTITNIIYTGVLTLNILYLICKTTKFNLLSKGILLFILLMFYYSYICIFFSEGTIIDVFSIVRIIQLLCCISVYLTTYYMRFRCTDLKLIRSLIFFISIIVLCYLTINGIHNMADRHFFRNNNYIGMLFFCFTVLYSLATYKYSFFYFLMISLLITIVFISGSRSSLIGIIIMFIFYKFFLLHRYKNYYFYKYIFHGVIIANLLFVIAYTILPYQEIGQTINTLTQIYTGKNFFSGRQLIWNSIITQIYQAPFIGNGLSYTVGNIYDTQLSAHNWYLQILLQSGMIGLVLIVMLIFQIYKRLLKFLWCQKACLGAAFLLAFLSQQSFEIAFTQNHLSIGLIVWFILGMLSNRSFYELH